MEPAMADTSAHTRAIAAGGQLAMDPQDHGVMYGWSFYDPDGPLRGLLDGSQGGAVVARRGDGPDAGRFRDPGVERTP
jgi:hypothetical protein